MWDVSAEGSAVSGETSEMAAQRELQEELGFQFDFSEHRPHLTIHLDVGFDDLYLIEVEVDIALLNLQYEEVQQVKRASEAEILALVANGVFIPYYQHLISLFFKKLQRRGAVKEI